MVLNKGVVNNENLYELSVILAILPFPQVSAGNLS